MTSDKTEKDTARQDGAGPELLTKSQQDRISQDKSGQLKSGQLKSDKRKIWARLIIGLLSGLIIAAVLGLIFTARTRPAFVVSVYDGDTMRVQIPGWPSIISHKIPIRVPGIDTPELRGKCAAEKAKAREARDRVRALLPKGKLITLRNIERGTFFRLVAEVWLEDQNIGALLLAEGLAAPYDKKQKPDWCGGNH
ncbi:MAG: thermonuclease family protein [Candidatus Puniceispirillaceae bacterium]